MFEELYDSLSGLMSWTWPTVEGEVTASNVRHVFSGEGTTFGLEIAYKFLVGEGGPYVGLFTWAGTSDKEACDSGTAGASSWEPGACAVSPGRSQREQA